MKNNERSFFFCRDTYPLLFSAGLRFIEATGLLKPPVY